MNRRTFILDSAATIVLGGAKAWGKHTARQSGNQEQNGRFQIADSGVFARDEGFEARANGRCVEPRPLTADSFFKIEDLPLLRDDVQTHQFCSYDRAGDNYDFEYFPIYTEPDGEVAIFDAMGPGCLYRHHMNIWKSWPQYNAAVATRGVKIRYYFDGEQQPRIDMDVSTFFSPKNPLGIFRYPLAVDGGDDFRLMYCPMFFKKRLKVALSRIPGGPGSNQIPWAGRWNMLPKRRNHWYEYTFHTFREDAGFDSWTPQQDETALFKLWDPKNLGRDPKPVEGNETESRSGPLPAGSRMSLAQIAGAGSISSLRISIQPVSEETLFETWLKITFDERSPGQVEAPLGGFFGANRKSLDASFSSLPLGYSPASMYCYFPMPYWKSAKVELENRGREDIKIVKANIHHKPYRAYPEKDCGYFFARYHKEFPRKEGIDYTYLDWIGTGHVVGHVTSRFDTSMEEDERTYFDGSQTPQIYGEGFEDDHNMGWGLKNLQHPIFGAMAAHGGAGTAYRFFTPDLYFFRSSVKHGHQVYGPHSPLGHEGLYQVGSEESVAFFYGRESPMLALTDELDVGKRKPESEHVYRATGNRQATTRAFWYEGEFNNVLFKVPPIEDDGVVLSGSSQFTVKIDPANQGVLIRRRTDKADNRQMADVYVDGRQVTERPWYSVDYDKTYRNIRWQDTDFEIPCRYTAGKSSIRLTVQYVRGEKQDWNEYYYWIFSILPRSAQIRRGDSGRWLGLTRERILVPAQANFTGRPVGITFFVYK